MVWFAGGWIGENEKCPKANAINQQLFAPRLDAYLDGCALPSEIVHLGTTAFCAFDPTMPVSAFFGNRKGFGAAGTPLTLTVNKVSGNKAQGRYAQGKRTIKFSRPVRKGVLDVRDSTQEETSIFFVASERYVRRVL